VRCERVSYFARMADADTFGERASFEIRRRDVNQAPAVAAVNDGAEWIQGFVQSHRANAIRILDFAHAAQYVGEIASLAQQAGVMLPGNWLAEQAKELKEQGPTGMLKEVRRIEGLVPPEKIREKEVYLCKRAGQRFRVSTTGREVKLFPGQRSGQHVFHR